MKKIQKIMALVLALVMCMAMSSVAFASGDPEPAGDPEPTATTYSVKITKDTTDKAAHTYGAFQIFTGKLETKDSKKVLSDIVWGSDIDDSKVATLITELNAIEGVTISGTATDTDIASKIAKAISDASLTNDSDKAQAVADAFNKALKSSTSKTGTIAANATEGTITGLDAGYYLIKDTVAVTGEGAQTRFMLQVVDNVEITEKASVPTVTKKVKEKNDTTGTESNWQDAADYDIGDSIPYQITGTLPSKFAEFDKYTVYTFTDTLSAGLTAPAVEGITIKVGETDVTSHFNITITGEAKAEQTIKIELKSGEDLRKWTEPALTTDSTFIVEYSAVLNDAAVIGSAGNPNTVKLEFTNNPNYDSDGEKGTTPDDKVTVFTYEIKALKVEADGNAIDQAAYVALDAAEKANYVKVGDKWQKTKALEGAGFTLYKQVPTTVDESGWKAVGTEITGTTTFEFKGTDAGVYKLVETTVPTGYNKADDITITVAATYDTEAVDPKLKSLTVTPDTAGFTVAVTETKVEDVVTEISTNGVIEGKVLNQSGSVLPSTGGIGTTIFYVLGSVMALGALVLLVTKRRVNVQ